MNIDPDREITITLPFGMIVKLIKATQVLSMFRDESDVRATIEIINAIHAGALEFIRQEDGEIMDYLSDGEPDKEFFLPPDNSEEKEEDEN